MSGQSSIPGAIGYLHGLAQQATQGTPEAVAEVGWVDGLSDLMFVVGSDGPPGSTAGEQAQASYDLLTMGGVDALAEEDYLIGCWMLATSGGTDQAIAITTVFALWDAFWPLLKADLTFGGVVDLARVRDFRLSCPSSKKDAANGRYALISFNVRCQFAYS